jgi:Glycosyl hydrolase family 99
VTARADAYVRADRPEGRFGGAKILRAGRWVRAYLRFTLPAGARGSALRGAKLRLYVTAGPGAALLVRSIASRRRLREGRLTWRSAPRPGRLLGRVRARPGRRVSVDVTQAARGSTAQFAITARARRSVSLASRESRRPPRLRLRLREDLQPRLPVRGIFYYPWFPNAWRQRNVFPYTRYRPSLGFYDGGAPEVIANHIRAMEHAHQDVAIASWWGQEHHTDERMPQLLANTARLGSPLRWALYYEREGQGDPSIAALRDDLRYVRDRYGSDASYFRIGRRFVVFVYADRADGCQMVDRWTRANTVGAYVVLKVFRGYRTCAKRPDGWHQYAPAVAADALGQSYTISPGFWKTGEASPRLERDLERFRRDAREMVASGARFQLVTTFNEWGEGTAVESATDWASASGFGAFVDALAEEVPPRTPPPRPPPAG